MNEIKEEICDGNKKEDKRENSCRSSTQSRTSPVHWYSSQYTEISTKSIDGVHGSKCIKTLREL